MGTFDEASVGDTVATDAARIDSARAERLIRDAGYVHPLFTDPDAPARAGFDARPVPGQIVLALLAGLAEQSGLVDDTVVALVGMDAIRFRRPVTAGSSLRLVTEVIDRRPKDDRGLLTYRWTGEVDGQTAVEAEATFLFERSVPADPGP